MSIRSVNELKKAVTTVTTVTNAVKSLIYNEFICDRIGNNPVTNMSKPSQAVTAAAVP